MNAIELDILMCICSDKKRCSNLCSIRSEFLKTDDYITDTEIYDNQQTTGHASSVTTISFMNLFFFPLVKYD